MANMLSVLTFRRKISHVRMDVHHHRCCCCWWPPSAEQRSLSVALHCTLFHYSSVKFAQLIVRLTLATTLWLVLTVYNNYTRAVKCIIQYAMAFFSFYTFDQMVAVRCRDVKIGQSVRVSRHWIVWGRVISHFSMLYHVQSACFHL